MPPEKMGGIGTRIISAPKEPKSRNERKRETAKGTILQSVMIEMDLLEYVRREAYESRKSLSDVINNALRSYFQ